MNHLGTLDLTSILRGTLDAPWFFGIEVVGTVAFAVSGLALARRDQFSLVGAFVLASLPAAGGGIMRDLIIGRPVAFLSTPLYLLLIVGTVVAGFFLFRIIDVYRHSLGKERTGRVAKHAASVIEFFDALGMAAFTVTGVVVAVEAANGPLLVWGPLFAMMTASGGGIVRDVVRADAGNPALKRIFYSEVAFIWGFVLSLFLSLFVSNLDATVVSAALILTIAGAFVTRWLAYVRGWTSPRFSLRTSIHQQSVIMHRSAVDEALANLPSKPTETKP